MHKKTTSFCIQSIIQLKSPTFSTFKRRKSPHQHAQLTDVYHKETEHFHPRARIENEIVFTKTVEFRMQER